MKTAVITGASSGLGREFVRQFYSVFPEIERVWLIARRTDRLQELAEQLEEKGISTLTLPLDLCDTMSFTAYQEHLVEEQPEIALLVNNAGISYVGLLTDMTIKDFDRTMKSNIYSVFNSCNRVVPYMVRAHKGHIINVSSVWGCCGASCEVAYSASKGAVNSFSKALGKELAPSGIAVNAIAFGAVDTTMNGHLSPDERQMLEDEIPAGRMATPQEAAEFICRIAGCGNYLNGQVITFDGAWQ